MHAVHSHRLIVAVGRQWMSSEQLFQELGRTLNWESGQCDNIPIKQ